MSPLTANKLQFIISNTDLINCSLLAVSGDIYFIVQILHYRRLIIRVQIPY